MLRRLILAVCAAVTVGLAAGSVACSSGTGTDASRTSTGRAAPPLTNQNNPRWLADDLPLLPTGVVMGVRPVAVMRATYEFAARHPEVMRYVPCFCGCERGGHKDNHDCFVGTRGADDRVATWDAHAIGCEVCVDVAYQALQMHNSGASVVAIRDAVEKKYAGHHGGHTPTPMPKRGGASHD